jgi:outer membrane protein assembly factor BamB
MTTYPTLRRCLLLGLTVAIFGAIAFIAVRPARSPLDVGGTSRADETPKVDMAHVWPLFGGTVHRNMVNTIDKNVPTEWSAQKGKEKNIKWVATLGSKAYGGPTISGGKIFVGTNNDAPRNPRDVDKAGKPIDKGIVMCFKEADGSFLWQAVHDKLPSGLVHDWPHEGICSTPLVEGNRVYYTSNRCEVVCADTEGFLDGKNDGAQDEKYKDKTDADFIWRLDMMKDLGVFPHNLAVCSPLAARDVLFIVTANGVDEGHINIPAPQAPSFIAVDKKTGKVVWKDSSPGLNIMHGQWSNPTFAEINGLPEIIFPGGDGWMRGFEPATGKLLWKFDCNPKNSKYELGGRGTKSDFIATPVVHENKLYIGVGQDPEHYEGVGHLWCIDLEKALRLATGPDNDVSPELVTDNSMFPPKTKPNPNSAMVWHFGGTATKADQEKIGRDYYFGRTMSTVAIHDGLVYAAELAGYLHCLDAKTGEKYWDHDLKAAIWGSAYCVDGKVYLATEDGDIFIFGEGKQKNVIGQVEMKGPDGQNEPVRSTPVVVNGVLYVMTERHLYAIANK